MTSALNRKFSYVIGICVAVVAQLVSGAALAEENLPPSVYRVANETPAAQPTATAPASTTGAAAESAAKNAARTPLDLTKHGNEHPLMPVIRALKTSEEEIDHNIRDYSCTFVKRERVDGELGDYQIILLKVMQQPFSVYMRFQQPYAGREVVYVEGQNDGKLVALDAGFTRVFGKMSLDPTGARAMSGQKYPITDVGIRNLCAKLTRMWEAEKQFAECEVTVTPGADVEGRPATMVRVVHPVPRQNFKFHIAQLFFDDELKIPIHFDAKLWPAQPGDDPPPEESYTYAKNLKINNNFTARDFDPNNNPDIFKK